MRTLSIRKRMGSSCANVYRPVVDIRLVADISSGTIEAFPSKLLMEESMKPSRSLGFGLAIATMLLGITTVHAQKKSSEPIKVFIFTAANEGGFVDPAQKQRNDSVEDLKKALDKKDLVQIVTQKDDADLTLEVLGRGGEETGSSTTSRGPYGTWNTSKDTVATVRVGLMAG